MKNFLNDSVASWKKANGIKYKVSVIEALEVLLFGKVIFSW